VAGRGTSEPPVADLPGRWPTTPATTYRRQYTAGGPVLQDCRRSAHAVAAGFSTHAGDLDAADRELHTALPLEDWRTDHSYL
jgi:hypothetical protein